MKLMLIRKADEDTEKGTHWMSGCGTGHTPQQPSIKGAAIP